MPVPSIIDANLPIRKLTGSALLAVSLLFVTKPVLAKGPGPAERIPLEPLGFQLPQSQFLLAGSTMMTVDFVDDTHLLLTYSSKRLLKRLPDCPPADRDHVIDAILMQLPDGKPIARASWRLHDHGQYLWNLGRGRFLLRNRDTLTTIAPLVNSAGGDAFKERPFIETRRRIGGVLLSPDADLLILETLEPLGPGGLEEGTGSNADLTDAQKARAATPVQINFFTVTLRQGDEIQLTDGVATRSRIPGRIPANSAGYISVLNQGQQHWAFDFNTYDGKTKELAPFDSTCRPSPILVSRGQFVAFGCHLSHTPQVIGGFNMRGEEMWEQNMQETYMAPTFAYAPAAGRFAFSRMITHTSLVTDETISPELIAGQSIIVYQAETGRQILHVDATPIARAGQNFALSPDGLSLAVIRTDALEIYSLPPLTGKEREAIKLAESSAPRIEGTPSPTALMDAAPPSTTDSVVIGSPAPKSPDPADAGAQAVATPSDTAAQGSSSSGSQSAEAPSIGAELPSTRKNVKNERTGTDKNENSATDDQKARKGRLYNEAGDQPGTTPNQQPHQ